MKHFTDYEYLLIDLANQYGLDKLLWEERIEWASKALKDIDSYTDTADNKYGFIKAYRAIEEATTTGMTGHLVGLDACSSGVQILSALSGDITCAEACNLINTGKRNDFYTVLADEMQKILKYELSKDIRKNIKQAGMTVFYGSQAEPKKLFGEDSEELFAFYTALEKLAEGPIEAMYRLHNLWDSTKAYYEFYLPDGHKVHIDVMVPEDVTIQYEEIEFPQRIYVNKPSTRGISIIANIVHSIDAYIARELVRRADFEVLPVHDAFYAHPSNCNKVRELYRDIMADIAGSDLLNNIIQQLKPSSNTFKPLTENLSDLIKESEYILS